MGKLNAKVQTYGEMQGQITEQISRLQANGEVPEPSFIKKLKEATDKLAKYQTLSSKLLQ